MNANEIIQKTIHEAGLNPLHVKNKLNDHLNSSDADMKQIGNTLMFIKPISKSAAQVHFVTQDSTLNIIHALNEFFKQLHSKNISTIYMKTESRRIINALNTIGIGLQHSNLPKYNLMAHV
jgi:hypothetical protein